jgi:serine/threonine protein kinase
LDPITPSRSESDRTSPGLAPPSISSLSEETIDWTETWTRGTLGVIGRYQLRERLGEGGFGQVFQAFDPRLDRDVALKVLKQPNPSERVMQRFFREARAAARLDHPNIVAVHDAGFENGRCWIAYQYISGRPLWWYRNHHPVDPPTAARIIRELADALDHAHRQGVLHRDLKPANVIMDNHGRPRLTDFGLARRADLGSSLTRDGAMVGTPAYMSPEQAQGNSNSIDERSDIYSLGIMFYELLHGHRPRESDDEPEPLSASGTSGDRFGRRRMMVRQAIIPPSLQRICDKALAPSLDERYPNARSLGEDLDDWLTRHRIRNASNRHPRMTSMLVGGALLAACVGVSFAFLPRISSRDQPFAVAKSGERLESRGEIGPTTDARLQAPPSEAASLLSRTSKGTGLIANKESKVYHHAESHCLNQMAERNRIMINSVSEAHEQGYRPCNKCLSK